MSNASDIADAIGRKRMADELGVGPTAVSNAVVRGWFPATWLKVITALAEQAGVSEMLNDELFKMKPGKKGAVGNVSDNTQSVDFRPQCKANYTNDPTKSCMDAGKSQAAVS